MSGPTVQQLVDSDWGREHLMVIHVPIGRWNKPKNDKPKDKK